MRKFHRQISKFVVDGIEKNKDEMAARDGVAGFVSK